MARNTYHDFLSKVPLFAGLDKHDLDVVGAAVTELQIDAGDMLMREGSTAREMVIILDGTVEVTRDGEHVADVGPGGFAGEMGLLTDAPRGASVSAKTDVRLLHIDSRQFDHVLSEAPEIAVKMLPIVASRVIDNSEDATD